MLRCPNCDYDLRGLLREQGGASVVCPECGRLAEFSAITALWEGLLPLRYSWAVATAPHVVAVALLLLDLRQFGFSRHMPAALVVLACWLVGLYGAIGLVHRLIGGGRASTTRLRMIAALVGAPLGVGAMFLDLLVAQLPDLLMLW